MMDANVLSKKSPKRWRNRRPGNFHQRIGRVAHIDEFHHAPQQDPVEARKFASAIATPRS